MKKIKYILAVAFAAVALSSCQKDPIGGTELQSLAGQWYVKVDAVDASGEVVYDDPYGMGNFMVLTYNTTDNNKTDLFIDDLGNFWEFKVQAKADIASKTFSVDKGKDLYNGIDVTVTGGKITDNGAITPSNMPADAIEFYIVFSDDDYIGSLYDRLRVYGYRYTGFANDD